MMSDCWIVGIIYTIIFLRRQVLVGSTPSSCNRTKTVFLVFLYGKTKEKKNVLSNILFNLFKQKKNMLKSIMN